MNSMVESEPVKRRRGGGREAKRAERTAAPDKGQADAYIKRGIPTFELVPK